MQEIKDVLINFRVTATQKKRLVLLAEHRNLSLTQTVENLINDAAEKELALPVGK